MNRRFKFSFDRTMAGTVLTGLTGQGVLVVSGVLVARNLGAHDRGELALNVAIAISVSFIVALGIPTAVAFWAAHDSASLRGALAAIRRWAILQLIVAFVVTAGAVSLLPAADRNDAVVIFIALAAVAAIVQMYGLGVLQGQNRFVAFNVLRLAPGVGYMIGVVALIALGEGSVAGFAVVWSLAYCAGALASVVAVTRALPRPGGEPVATRELVAYGVKAQIGTASPLENFSIDQLLVGALAGTAQLGYYVIGAAFTNLPRFIAQSLGMVVFPRVAERLGRGDARIVAREALQATIVLSGGTVIALELAMGWLVPFFFGAAFEPSVPVARIMLIGSFCFSMRRVLSDALRGAKRPFAGTLAEIVAWVFYAALVVPMTSEWDAKGAAGAVAIAAAAGLVLIAVAARRAAGTMTAGMPEPEQAMTGPPAAPAP